MHCMLTRDKNYPLSRYFASSGSEMPVSELGSVVAKLMGFRL